MGQNFFITSFTLLFILNLASQNPNDQSYSFNDAPANGNVDSETVLLKQSAQATHKVLIYHETNGFRHGSIANGIDLITNLGVETGLWTTEDTMDSAIFSDPTFDYDLVVWCNTSGNNLLTAAEQADFEVLMTSGVAFMGIHAATDTYRDRSWPFYNELVGAIVQTSPNHTNANKVALMDVLQEHPSVSHLQDSWNKREEYYYWERNGGQLSTDNNNVLFVESTGGNDYDAPRPMAWYKTQITVGGVTSDVRAFYTALGHRGSDYGESDFKEHIKGAILWALPADEMTFTSGAWSPETPELWMNAVINDDYDSTVLGDIEVRNLVINEGNDMLIGDGSSVLVQENLAIDGLLEIESEGSLVQRDRASVATKGVNGAVRIKKQTLDMKPRDFMFVSSPVTTETRDGVYGNVTNITTNTVDQAFRVIYLNPENFISDPAVVNFPAYNGGETFLSIDNTFLGNHTAAEAIVPAEGLIVYPQASYEAGGLATGYEFAYEKGVPNTGTVAFPIQYNGSTQDNFNLLGNPYASAIDIEKFIVANPMVNEVYFWDHVTTPNNTLPGYLGENPSMNDFSMRNLLTGMAAPNNPSKTPSRFMASGQGFAIKADQTASATPSVVFTNEMRVVGNNDQYRNVEAHEAQLLHLRLENIAYELKSTAIIGFTEKASEILDPGYDSKRMATPISLYSTLESGEQLGIQALGVFDPSIAIPVGIATGLEGTHEYRIMLESIAGIDLKESPVYLIDLEEKKYVNLKEKHYTFVSSGTMVQDRFVVRFEEPESLSLSDAQQTGAIQVYPNPVKDQIFISVGENIKVTGCDLFDQVGRRVWQAQGDTNATVTAVNVSALPKGVYLLSITTQETTVVKKIIKEE